jgi:hypothetical protein
MPANQYSQMENFGTELVEGTHANRMGHFPEIEQTKKGNDSLVSSSTSIYQILDSPAPACGIKN